ncbi:hypothetical protein [Salinarimonas soli]|uniref:Uncharacterized protein n=1 Tax=Salinarimonas soli TaxID=1638099 RepID=A0A5B2VH83_9HYPH|nr:hypothetical protein [Salinarimonas soli]KAA2238305.1 hypothetical protein F0L46_05620 [Salinarimonas soli]
MTATNDDPRAFAILGVIEGAPRATDALDHGVADAQVDEPAAERDRLLAKFAGVRHGRAALPAVARVLVGLEERDPIGSEGQQALRLVVLRRVAEVGGQASWTLGRCQARGLCA